MSDSKSSLPPGPGGSRLLNTLQVLKNPQKAFSNWFERYGDPFLVHALNGPIVVTGNPELVKQVFSHKASDFDAFGKRALVPTLGAGSMLAIDGEQHRQERKLMMPMFHGQRMKSYGDIVRQATLAKMQEQQSAKSFEMLDVTTAVSLQVIIEAILGSQDEESTLKLMRLARETIRRSLPILFFSPRTQISFFGLSPWDRFLNARKQLRNAFDEELSRRKQNPRPSEDVFSLLMDAKYEDGSCMSSDRMFDELGTFLFAGHETSAIAMAWATYFLLSAPAKLEKLKEELASCDSNDPAELAKLPYLKAVVSETLRLNPIVTEVLRVLNKPMEFAGYQLPAGVAVAPATVAIHYNEEIYPDAKAFVPERFLERNFASNEYFPFGGGARRCAGSAFALYEMTIALGTIFSNYELELLETQPVRPVRRNVTMGPSSGIRVAVQACS